MKPLLGTLGVFVCGLLHAQIYETNVTVQVFVGSGFQGYVDGQGTENMFYSPSQIVTDTAGNFFVRDGSKIRKITPDGTVTTFAGGGTVNPPAYGTNAVLLSIDSLTIDHSNVLWTAGGAYLYRIAPDGYVTRTNLNTPVVMASLCVDSGNNVYIADSDGDKIYRYKTNGTLEVFAGSGNQSSVDGNGIFSSFSSPSPITSDAADNIYVYDNDTRYVRRINTNRDVVTLTRTTQQPASDGQGTNASAGFVISMCVDSSGNLLLTSSATPGLATCVRKLTAATNLTTLAGSFTQMGYTNGVGSLARFKSIRGICVSDGKIYVADASDYRIRQLTYNATEQPVSPASLNLRMTPSLSITGLVGRTYRVESSPDMSTWTPRATILLTRSPYLWLDENSAGQRKFYRAFLLP